MSGYVVSETRESKLVSSNRTSQLISIFLDAGL
jgi:hypothetical protein